MSRSVPRSAPVERLFLGWERPFFELAVARWIEWVVARGYDPATCLIVVPGQRAVRRLEERIAASAPLDWTPPRVISESGLATALSAEPLALASGWQSALAWREALNSAASEEREALWSGQEAMPTRSLARACARTFDELAAEGIDPDAVASRAGSEAVLGSERRWRAFARLAALYRAALERRGVLDPADAPAHVVHAGLTRTDLRVQLFAVVDLTRAQRELLHDVPTASFIFAPEECATDVDEYGSLLAARWAERDLTVPLDRWVAVDGPDDQACAALSHLARIEPPPCPEDVTLGVPDSDVRPYLERRLIEAGVEPRWAGGGDLARTRPAHWIAAAIEWLSQPNADSFAALIRHPDVEAALGASPGEIARAFDAYSDAHVPNEIDGAWIELEGDRRSTARVPVLRRAFDGLRELFGPLAGPHARSSTEWADAIATTVERLWVEVDLGARDHDGWLHARALAALADVLDEARASDEKIAAHERTMLKPRDVLELLSERFAQQPLPPPPGKNTVELLGWLELALDDAPHLIVTGANEGSLPQPAGADAFLFEPVRRALGLAHEAHRVARDAWAMSAILHSRPQALFVSGRRSSQRDPRIPSRFLFRGGASDVVARVERAWPSHADERPPPVVVRAKYVPPLIETPPPMQMPVTSFRQYLSSPYEFYLRYVRRLDTFEDGAAELDARRFGDLAHAVLEAFGKSAFRVSTSADLIRRALDEDLDRIAHARFGEHVCPAVRVQIETLRRRLDAFALWQAQQAADGWTIFAVEYEAHEVELDQMRLKGRIDRIDFHPGRKEWRVLDYKTGDKGSKPSAIHGKPGAWKDLQLPLYRYLTESLWMPNGAPQLGFVSLDRDPSGERWLEFPLSDDAYEDALATARDVIANVRAGQFAEVGEREPLDGVVASLCGFGLAPEDDDDDDSEGEA